MLKPLSLTFKPTLVTNAPFAVLQLGSEQPQFTR